MKRSRRFEARAIDATALHVIVVSLRKWRWILSGLLITHEITVAGRKEYHPSSCAVARGKVDDIIVKCWSPPAWFWQNEKAIHNANECCYTSSDVEDLRRGQSQYKDFLSQQK
ncbi:unnamed protein product [Amoebophrya sp. A25]|nr:unnamed protein product [Amoebophrya sp. A25]|eukprot:GSA25T00005983001.1